MHTHDSEDGTDKQTSNFTSLATLQITFFLILLGLCHLTLLSPNPWISGFSLSLAEGFLVELGF